MGAGLIPDSMATLRLVEALGRQNLSAGSTLRIVPLLGRKERSVAGCTGQRHVPQKLAAEPQPGYAEEPPATSSSASTGALIPAADSILAFFAPRLC